MKHNDLDIENWKECDINTDSLWLIKERDKSGKHANFYHGNFVPQIPNQSSGTKLFESLPENVCFVTIGLVLDLVGIL